MARTNKNIRIRVRTSFHDMYAGEEAEIPMTLKVQGWISAGLVEVVDGQDQAGPGGVESDDAGRKPARAGGGVPAGGESGKGFGAGGYGTSPGVDQG